MQTELFAASGGEIPITGKQSALIEKAPAQGDKPTADVKPNSPNFK